MKIFIIAIVNHNRRKGYLMNKTMKTFVSLLMFGLVFACGFVLSELLSDEGEPNTQSQWENEDNPSSLTIATPTTPYPAVEGTNTATNDESNQNDVGYQPPALTEAELAFLQEHLFGQWRFVERMIALDAEDPVNKENYNFSDAGVEAIKNQIVIRFSEKMVAFVRQAWPGTFSNPHDLWLYAMSGGFQWTPSPRYSVNPVSHGMIDIFNVYYPRTYVSFDASESFINEDFIQVVYVPQSFLYDIVFLRMVAKPFADTIYIDPNDTDTIYVDVCGIWRLERDHKEYVRVR